MAAIIEYPSFASGEPVRLSAQAILAIGAELRKRLFGFAVRPLDVAGLAQRASRLRVNGRDLRIAWDTEHAVHDDKGNAVLGVCAHDPCEPGTVLISLNGPLLADQPELLRSIAAHELGHAIFDMPAAMAAGAMRAFRSSPGAPAIGPVVDWKEWRADEFMGAFLAPRRQLTRSFTRQATSLGARVRWEDGEKPMPFITQHNEDRSMVDAIAFALAEEFGVSEALIAVRLRKYRLVR
jgi:hypothetical protein